MRSCSSCAPLACSTTSTVASSLAVTRPFKLTSLGAQESTAHLLCGSAKGVWPLHHRVAGRALIGAEHLLGANDEQLRWLLFHCQRVLWHRNQPLPQVSAALLGLGHLGRGALHVRPCILPAAHTHHVRLLHLRTVAQWRRGGMGASPPQLAI